MGRQASYTPELECWDTFVVDNDFLDDQSDLNAVDTITDSGSAVVGDARKGVITLLPSDGSVADNDEVYLATPNEVFCFVAAKPIPQVLRNINAYLMGARSVKPGITCSVIFTGDWSMAVKEAEATNALIDQGADVITWKCWPARSRSSRPCRSPAGDIRNRIRLLNEKYGQQSSISITDKKNISGSAGSGTLVTLHLPLEINEE